MERKYSQELLELIAKRQKTVQMNGFPVLVKNLPDSDEKGAMDPRLYAASKMMGLMMKVLPKGMLKMDASPKGIVKLRKMFNGVKSIPIVTSEIAITHKSITGVDGNKIPLCIYKPVGCVEGSPVLLYFHGGGFFGGSPDVVEELVKVIVEREKIPAVSVDYRLAPENPFPAGHSDCFSALEWLYANAASIGADKNKITVSGDSAGGNLAIYCAIKDKELGTQMVRAQMLLYPTVNMGGIDDPIAHWDISKYEISPKQKSLLLPMISMMSSTGNMMGDILGVKDVKIPYLTPYMADLAGLPPTLVTVGEHDGLMVECMALAAKLQKAGVKTKTILYRGFGHAYGDNIGVYPQSEDCAIEMGKFIRENS